MTPIDETLKANARYASAFDKGSLRMPPGRMIVHHTDCGMLTFTDESLRRQLKERGVDADEIAFLPFSNVEESVRADLDAYDRSPFVRDDIPVRGFVFDVKTGRIHEVARKPLARAAGA